MRKLPKHILKNVKKLHQYTGYVLTRKHLTLSFKPLTPSEEIVIETEWGYGARLTNGELKINL